MDQDFVFMVGEFMNKNVFKSALFWLLFAVFVKQIVWVGIIPLWHFPDEQAHFGQVQNYAEYGVGKNNFSSDEIAISENLLGVYRDKRGNNKYTFHPEFNIEYSNSTVGVDEKEIRDLSDKRNSHEYKLGEATSYPLLYYLISSWIYQLFYEGDLFVRDFAVRSLSVILFTLNIWIVYLIGKILFSKLHKKKRKLESELLPIGLSILVAFHPMFSFVGASVNSDVLFNLLFTLLIYGSLLIINDLKKLEGWAWVVLSLVLGMMTKQQMIIGFFILPILFLPYLKRFFVNIKNNNTKNITSNKIKVFFTILIVSILLFAAFKLGEFERAFGFLNPVSETHDVGLIDHLRWTMIHTYREIIPWYWGVFKWLSLTYPRWIHRVQMLILLISSAGLAFYFWKELRSLKYQFKEVLKKNKNISLLLFVSVLYFLSITLFDWRFRISHGFPFGVQGRYFFPVIVAQMELLLMGWMEFFRFVFKVIFNFFNRSIRKKQIFTKHRKELFVVYSLILLLVWWFVFHGIALFTVSNSYYDLSNFESFITQVSQYKPILFKGNIWVVLVCLYFVSSAYLIVLVVKSVKFVKKNL